MTLATQSACIALTIQYLQKLHMQSNRITTVAAGRMLGYGKDKIQRMCEDGKFPGARRDGHGKHWRIPVADLEAFLEASKPKVLRRRQAA